MLTIDRDVGRNAKHLAQSCFLKYEDYWRWKQNPLLQYALEGHDGWQSRSRSDCQLSDLRTIANVRTHEKRFFRLTTNYQTRTTCKLQTFSVSRLPPIKALLPLSIAFNVFSKSVICFWIYSTSVRFFFKFSALCIASSMASSSIFVDEWFICNVLKRAITKSRNLSSLVP